MADGNSAEQIRESMQNSFCRSVDVAPSIPAEIVGHVLRRLKRQNDVLLSRGGKLSPGAHLLCQVWKRIRQKLYDVTHRGYAYDPFVQAPHGPAGRHDFQRLWGHPFSAYYYLVLASCKNRLDAQRDVQAKANMATGKVKFLTRTRATVSLHRTPEALTCLFMCPRCNMAIS